LGNDFPKVLKCSYKALRPPIWLVVEALERKWGIQAIVDERRGILPGVGQACGE